MSDTRAWLLVSSDMAEAFRLPTGFREVWCRDYEFSQMPGVILAQELLIEGPFSDAVQDGARVTVHAELRGIEVWWQWVDRDTMKPVSDWEMIIQGP